MGQNALHLASAHGHAPVVKALLAAGAPLNATDPGGTTALQLAVEASQVATPAELPAHATHWAAAAPPAEAA